VWPLEVAGSTAYFLRTIWYFSNLLNRVFNIHLIGFQLRATKREWKSALKRRGIVFLQKPKPVRATSKRQYAAASREVQEPWIGIHEWLKTKQGDWYTDWQSKRSCTWALSLCVDNTVASKQGKAVSFKIGLCSDPYL